MCIGITNINGGGSRYFYKEVLQNAELKKKGRISPALHLPMTQQLCIIEKVMPGLRAAVKRRCIGRRI